MLQLFQGALCTLFLLITIQRLSAHSTEALLAARGSSDRHRNIEKMRNLNTIPDERVNEFDNLEQNRPVAASIGKGDLVFVWQSLAQNGNDFDIYFRIYFYNGTAKTHEILAHSLDPVAHTNPEVSRLPDGGFIIVYESPVGGTPNIFYRLFNADGVALDIEQNLNDDTSSESYVPVVTVLKDGRILILRASNILGSFEIVGRMLDSSGTKIGTEFVINDVTGVGSLKPRVAALENGGFVAVWESAGAVLYRIFDKNGDPVVSQQPLSVSAFFTQTDPDVAPLINGGFAAVWSVYTGSDFDCMLRIFDDYFDPVTGETLVTSVTTGEQTSPGVIALENEEIVVTFIDDQGFPQVYQSIFDASGAVINTEFQVNTDTYSSIAFPRPVAFGAGYVVSFAGTLTSIDVYHQRYSTARAARCQVNGHCAGSYCYCAIEIGFCVQAKSEENCTDPSFSKFNSDYYVCEVCGVDSDCSKFIDRPYCALLTRACTPCLPSVNGSIGCSDPFQPFCSPTNFSCVPCSGDIDCTTASPHCLTTGECSKCLEGLIFYNSQCLSECPAGTFLDSTRQCQIIPSPTPNGTNTTNTTTNTSTPVQNQPVKATSPTLDQEAVKFSTTEKIAAAAAVGGPLVMAGADPTLVWSFVNLMQMFYYLLFLNLDYPTNVKRFLEIFSLGRTNFLPNPFSGLLGNQTLSSPKNFNDNQFTGYFFETAGPTLALLLISFGIYLLGKLAWILSRRKWGIALKMINFYEWSGLIRGWFASYLELTFASLLQLYTLQFQGTILFASSICGIVVFIANLLLPIFIVLVVRRSLKSRAIAKKYEPITEDYDLHDPVKKYFALFTIMRKMLQAIAIVALYHQPLLQIIAVWIVIFMHLSLLMVYRPHSQNALNLLDIFIEINFFAIHSILIPIGYQQYIEWLSPSIKEKIGYMIIGCCLCAMAVQLALLIKEQVMAVISLIKKLRNKSPSPPIQRIVLTKTKKKIGRRRRELILLKPHSKHATGLKSNRLQN